MIAPAQDTSATAVTTALRQRQTTALALTEATLNRIARTHATLNAFTHVTAARALEEAAAVDAVLQAGRDPGPLAGVPYVVKNLFDLAGVVTVAGSKIHRDALPASTDATAVARLRAAGAVCLGAVNMGEYAYDFVTENAHDGSTRNPLDPRRSAGGSSGGTAAAVAAGLASFGLATDTNGSIRVPASFCGLWGLKPTYGRLSRGGTLPFVESLDHIGPLARTVADLALTYDVMQGHDPRDIACQPRAVEPALPGLNAGIDGLRIAVLDGYFASGGVAQAHAAVAAVAKELGVVRHLCLPAVAEARAAAYVITSSEGGQFHLDRLRTRAAEFDPASRDRFRAGALLPAAWYLHAQRFRTWWREQVRAVFQDVDVLIAPATPVPATELGQETMTINGVTMPVRPHLGLFTQPLSFIGLPVVAAPVFTHEPMPIGVQLVAAPWAEATLLRVARVLERSGLGTRPHASS